MKRLIGGFLLVTALFAISGCPAVGPGQSGRSLVAEWRMTVLGTLLPVWFYDDGSVEVDNIASPTNLTGEWFDRGGGRITFTYYVNTVDVSLQGGTTLDTATEWTGTINTFGNESETTGFRVSKVAVSESPETKGWTNSLLATFADWVLGALGFDF